MKALLSTSFILSTVLFISSCGPKVTQLEVINHSFEAGEVPAGLGQYTVGGNGLPGWDVAEGGTNGGAFRPAPANFTSVPDGTQTAWLLNLTICQILTSPVVEKATYTLRVEVGRDAAPNIVYSGYRIQLRAGGILLAEDNNTKAPPSGGWVTAQVEYVSPAADSNAGKLLEICLTGLNNSEADFDNVRLEQSL